MTATERRSLERFKLQLLSRLKVRGKEKDRRAIELLTRDVSAGGAFINTPQPLEVGTRIEMDLIIRMDRFGDQDDHAAIVNLTGIIIRADDNGMAICFDDNFKVSRLKKTPDP